MSRYVNADAIKGKAWKAESEACFYALEDVVSVTDIDEAPSIDIVRCKECKRRKENGFCLEHNRYEKNDNGYCSYGERREP